MKEVFIDYLTVKCQVVLVKRKYVLTPCQLCNNMFTKYIPKKQQTLKNEAAKLKRLSCLSSGRMVGGLKEKKEREYGMTGYWVDTMKANQQVHVMCCICPHMALPLNVQVLLRWEGSSRHGVESCYGSEGVFKNTKQKRSHQQRKSTQKLTYTGIFI